MLNATTGESLNDSYNDNNQLPNLAYVTFYLMVKFVLCVRFFRFHFTIQFNGNIKK